MVMMLNTPQPKNQFHQQLAFMVACDQTVSTFNHHQCALYLELINEEFKMELKPALQEWIDNTVFAPGVNNTVPIPLRRPAPEDAVTIVDGVMDTIVVLLGLVRSMGLPAEALWDVVAKKNLEKIGEDGKVTRRADGKILKPEGWTPPEPELLAIIEEAYREMDNEKRDY